MGTASGLSRQAKISTAAEIDEHAERLRQPRVKVVSTKIVPVEPAPHPGWEDPILGPGKVRALEVLDDLDVMILPRIQERVNRWELDADGQAEFDEVAKDAEFYASAKGPIWSIPLVLTCREDGVDELLNDDPETMYWSGGWRSSKTYSAINKWARIFAKKGGKGRRLWLLGPQVLNAWRIFEKIFRGREGVAPIIPTLGTDIEGYPRSVLASGMPKTHKERDLSFPFDDGTLCEILHAKGKGGHIEGESIIGALLDEVARVRSADVYDVLCGRVMEDGGQVLLSGVPDDEGPWVFEKVVSEAERQKAMAANDPAYKPNKVVIYLSGYDNPYIPDDAIKRREEAEPDPIVREQKIYGRWTRSGLYAYADVWAEAEQTRDELGETGDQWGLGQDITAHVTRALSGGYASKYLIGVDFNDPPKPQTRMISKIFGHPNKWETWNLVVIDEVVSSGDAQQAAAELARRKDGKYQGALIVCDCNGFHHPKQGHGSGDRRLRSFQASYYANAGFRPLPPIRNWKPDGSNTVQNPGVGESRTVVRHLMREKHLWVNSGQAPRTLFAIKNAPNRGKRNSDKNTWVEAEVYGLEDCLRYKAWWVFESFIRTRKLELEAQAEAIAEGTDQ